MGRLRVALVGIALIAGGCTTAATPGPATPAAVGSPTPAALVASAAPSASPAQPTPAPTAAATVAVAPATSAPTPTAQPTPTIGPSEAPTDLNGTWVGTWQNSTPDTSAGTFQITWARKGKTMAGTIKIDGTPCLTGGTITGTLSGDKIAFGAVSGQVEVSYTAPIAGSRMSGTYATNCGEARGDWEATHK